MSKKFHELDVASVEAVTDDCVVVSFEVPNQLKDQFSFIPGQYLTLETEINEENVRRSYSLCSAPFEQEWKVAIKKVENGKFSTYANEKLKSGDTISVMEPDGNFQLSTDESNENHYVAFAAGSGITPILSMIKSVLRNEPKSKFSLFFGKRNFETIIF